MAADKPPMFSRLQRAAGGMLGRSDPPDRARAVERLHRPA